MVCSTRPRATIAGIAIAGLVLVGCSAGSSPSPAGSDGAGMDMASMGEHDEEFAFGEPADASEADRTVEVIASDDFAYDPAEIDVQVGETVTFRVENTGQIIHEFVLGDEAAQRDHSQEMAKMSPGTAMHDEANALSIDPGQTEEITWTFTAAGELRYGCHQPGHYDAGMVGTITVSE